MIEMNHPRLSIVRQCELVGVARSSFYYTGKGETPLNLDLMRVIDEQFMETPWYGSRQMARHLRRKDYEVGQIQICTVCGHTMVGDAPEHCPVCASARKSYVAFA